MAHLCLADCRFTGRGVDQDYPKAIELYQECANRGIAQASLHLAQCYENGESVKQDLTTAVISAWRAAAMFRQLANEGHAESQFWYGCCYYYRRGESKDNVEAFRWLSKAAEQGNSYAQLMVGKFYYAGRGTAKDFGKAVEWFRKSAEQGNREGRNELGGCYKRGNGVTKDIQKANFWYGKSMELE
ncbi:uncharacterized protein BJ171DRAFT_458077 [Polychytrium aggregatum]|uniref:uncharacterized protein n=1 Tax=Polychytrium aggregatum TaxID=110093 RepID=UPI0022FF2F8D|nr:uncharacterized protein BJ171DRAFT_458077 [Polychytrium aggregatum]KAI9205935.1 hypothetical protein BJ171DRAFT_458077 [Polychytrium aggregatum]